MLRALIFALGVVLTLVDPARAEEWRAVEPSRTIKFTAPGLEGVEPRYIAEQHFPTYSYREVGVWTGATGARAEIMYAQAAPGRVFDPVAIALGATDIKNWNFFKNTEITVGSTLQGSNAYGPVESVTFSHTGAQCFAFRQYTGEHNEDLRARKSNLVSGYYCAEPRRSLSAEEIHVTLRLFRLEAR